MVMAVVIRPVFTNVAWAGYYKDYNLMDDLIPVLFGIATFFCFYSVFSSFCNLWFW